MTTSRCDRLTPLLAALALSACAGPAPEPREEPREAGPSAQPSERAPRREHHAAAPLAPQRAFALQVEPRDAGLPDPRVRGLARAHGSTYAATAGGLARWTGSRWEPVALSGRDVRDVIAWGDGLLAWSDGALARVGSASVSAAPPLPDGVRRLAGGARPLAAGARAVWRLERERWTPLPAPPVSGSGEVLSLAQRRDGLVALGASDGLYLLRDARWTRLLPADTTRRWAPRDVRAVCFDRAGALWFGAREGLGRWGADGWTLLTHAEGLPVGGATVLEPGEAASPESAADGASRTLWIGTDQGLLQRADGRWAYRQGPRWLPADGVRDVLAGAAGEALVATDAGVRLLRPHAALSAKAARLWRAAERFHRRTPLGFVYGRWLDASGDPSAGFVPPSDNDGLWTSMYGAAACFTYAATRDPAAKARAERAFAALRFLVDVTQGGERAPPPGFPARTVVPAAAGDPNLRYPPEKDRLERAEDDARWKLIHPRWLLSADGRWYWKCDTSTDELNGHFFFYAQYHDLVCETEAERAPVRAVVRRIADHLLAHGLRLVDWDGRPTRWAELSPDALNRDPGWWEDRGLNSLTALSILTVAEHVTGDPRYAAAARDLVERHGYALNTLGTRADRRVGRGNPSDDQLAVLAFYPLLLYEDDAARRATYALAFRRWWEAVRPQANPLFTFAFAAACTGARFRDAFGVQDLTPPPEALVQAAETLWRMPLDRRDHAQRNSHRLDVVRLASEDGDGPRGLGQDGLALPIDERWQRRWSSDPYELDHDGDGRFLAAPTPFLLAYALARYHGFVK